MATRTAYNSLKRLFSSVFGTRTAVVPNAHHVAVYDGTDVKKTLISTLTARVISDDGITNIGGVVDLTARTGTDTVLPGTDDVTKFILTEGDVAYVIPEDGFKLVQSVDLSVQGNADLTVSPNDVLVVVGQAGDVGKVESVRKESGGLARPSLFHCRTIVTTPITISTGLNNGDTQNGIVLATGNVVLLVGQTLPQQNGVYIVGTSPARHPLFSTYDSMLGVQFVINEGPTFGIGAPSIWACNSVPGGTIDTTSLSFEIVVGSLGRQSNDGAFLKAIWFGLFLLAPASSYSVIVVIAGSYTTSRQLGLNLNDGNRALDLSGNLTLTGDASIEGTNTGDVNKRETHTLYTDFGPGSPTAGSLVVGGIYTIDVSRVGDDFTNVAHVISGTINTDGCEFIATGTTPSNWSNGTSLITYGEQALTGLIPNSTERIVKRVTMRKASTDISGMGGPFYVGFNAGVAQDVLGTTDPGTISEKMMQLVTTDRVVIAKETSLSHADDGTQVGADNSQSFCGLAGQVLRGIFSDISVGGATVKVDVEYYDVPA
jgi:hypothetical protein